MPPSALESLSRLNISYPMLFKIENRGKARTSHTGKYNMIISKSGVVGHVFTWLMTIGFR